MLFYNFKIICLAVAVAYYSSASAQDFAALEARLDRYVEEGELPGGVILVRRGDETLLAHAFGFRDREADDAMQIDDQFRIASQTKLIVSVGIMMLIEDGVLTLDTPLTAYFPEWQNVRVATPSGTEELARPIVLRDLLSHSSGIGYGFTEAWFGRGFNGWYFAESDRPIREAVRAMADVPLAHQPGSGWTYGYNTDILGALIAEVTGKPLGVFLDERLFEPLGMEKTQFFLDADEADNLAVVYSRQGDALLRAPDPGGMVGQGHYVQGPKVVESGGAGLISTAEDYVRVLDMLRAGGAFGGQQLLSSETAALMTEPVITSPAPDWYPGGTEFQFGLGHEVSKGRPNGRAAGSLGWGGAYHSVYWIDPDYDLSVVYLTQVIPSGDLDDETVIEQMIYNVLRSEN
ncbi:MAG: serine hydrolase domain-containing protein [Pseudomonadota bacterium]